MGDSLAGQVLRRSGALADLVEEELRYLENLGVSKQYEAGEFLFHEREPREWWGVVTDGEVSIGRGLHGQTTELLRAGPGSILGEALLLGKRTRSVHSASAKAQSKVTVIQWDEATTESIRSERPTLLTRLLEGAAREMNARLAASGERLLEGRKDVPHAGAMRREHDLLGQRDLPEAAYFGIHTARALDNFPISGTPISSFGRLVEAMAYVKKACAEANAALGLLPQEKAGAIVRACDEIIAGKWHDQFVVDVIQGGAGTSTNMNANEVIANRGLELLGHRRGEYHYLHPNDDVNKSQSTNDVYPTAIKLAVQLQLRGVLGALSELAMALRAKAAEFAGVLKMGRTENQDAVPMTLGQEFGAYAVMIEESIERLKDAAEPLLYVNLGGTAIGTGINTVEGYAEVATLKLAEATRMPFRLSRDLVEATQDAGEYVQFSATMKRVAVQLAKICGDLRWLSSGPRCGLGEIRLPELQAGSSIMPGKVNPVVPEVVTEVCFHIIACDTAVSLAAERGELELNAFEPLIAYEILHGLSWLENAALVLTHKCIKGIQADADRCRAYVEHSIGLVTALNPVIGYERAVQVAREAQVTGKSVADLVREKGWLSDEELKDILRPERMVRPRELPAAK